VADIGVRGGFCTYQDGIGIVNVSENIDAVKASEIADEPYPGLRSFYRDETHIFFGREGTINTMVDRLAAHRFLAVTGASGSGKSSLVRTGLLDALDRGLLADAGADWRVVDFRPAGQPLAALTDALIAAIGEHVPADALPIVQARLARGSRGLVDWLDEVGFPRQTNLLLLVDQFEELFRIRQGLSADEADAFVALLLASAAQRQRRTYVVITMRSDFIGDCAQFPGLAEAINDGQFLTPRLTREQCRQAIEGPATVYGGRVEPALVSRMLNDMGSNPDQLPLMQHVLMLMWRTAPQRARDQGPVLTLAQYEAVGGISGGPLQQDAAQRGESVAPERRSNGALSDHADKILAELTPEQQRLAAILFRALTESEGTHGRDVRRPTMLREAADIAEVPPADLIPVVEAFRTPGRNFLMPAAPVPLKPDTVIDISHESLIRQWATLRNWVREEFESAERYRHLEKTALLWEKGEADLLTMPYLGLALAWREREHPNAAWAARYGARFPLAVRFLDASRRRYIRKRLTRRILVVSAVSAAIIAASAVAVLQYFNARESESKLAEVRSSQIDVAQEVLDYHVVPQQNLKSDVGTNTPTSIPGGTRILTPDLYAKVKSDEHFVLIDALYGKHNTTIPNAIRISNSGLPGSFDDDIQYHLERVLRTLTENKPDATLVFFCLGMRCWESYNASLRAIRLGYTQVFWYRGGIAAWQSATLAMDELLPQVVKLQRQLWEAGETRPGRRHIWAIQLGEAVHALLQNQNFSGAYAAAKLSHDVLQTLATSDPANGDLQYDLAVSNWRLGDVFKAYGNDRKSNGDGKANDVFVSAVAAYREGIGIAEKLDPDPRLRRKIASIHTNIGDALDGKSDLAGALSAYRDTLAIYKDEASRNPNNVELQKAIATSTDKLGDALRAQPDLNGALAAYRAELAILEALAAQPEAGDQQGLLWRTHLAIGHVHKSLGDTLEALRSYRSALSYAQAEAARYPDDTDWQWLVAITEENIGNVLKLRHDMKGALASYGDALEIRTSLVKNDSKNEELFTQLGLLYDEIGDALLMDDRPEEAIDTYQKSHGIFDKLVASAPTESKRQLQLERNSAKIGRALALLSKADESRDVFRKALSINQRLVEADRTNTELIHDLSMSHIDLGALELSVGQVHAAADQFEAAMRLSPANHFSVLWLHIARLRGGENDRSELAANAEKLNHDEWPWPIVAFYLGSISSEDLRAKARGKEPPDEADQLCKADFYLGAYLATKGNRAEAQIPLQSAAKNCPATVVEHMAAKLELVRLRRP
jgi:PQQ-dependent catabolism-associated CXXCW motif protein